MRWSLQKEIPLLPPLIQFLLGILQILVNSLIQNVMRRAILVPFFWFKKREKHSWRSVTFNKVTSLSNSPWVFFTFFEIVQMVPNHATHLKWFEYFMGLFTLIFWNCLIHFSSVISFYTSWKLPKVKSFLAFSGGMKWDHWPEMG